MEETPVRPPETGLVPTNGMVLDDGVHRERVDLSTPAVGANTTVDFFAAFYAEISGLYVKVINRDFEGLDASEWSVLFLVILLFLGLLYLLFRLCRWIKRYYFPSPRTLPGPGYANYGALDH